MFVFISVRLIYNFLTDFYIFQENVLVDFFKKMYLTFLMWRDLSLSGRLLNIILTIYVTCNCNLDACNKYLFFQMPDCLYATSAKTMISRHCRQIYLVLELFETFYLLLLLGNNLISASS